MSIKLPEILAVVGPTASGKTALAIELAKLYNGEIISADSMQIYKGLDIGTAKPSLSELATVKHHMIDIVEPGEVFSVSRYTELASAIADSLIAKGKLPIVAGGTGLYIKALINGMDFTGEGANDELRLSLRKYAEQNGADALWAKLSALDPERAAEIHPNNIPRVMRALEYCMTTGKKMSSRISQDSTHPPRYKALKLGLNFPSREMLYNRINKRVDIMFSAGLREEAMRIFEMNLPPDSTAMQAIGYKEFLRCSDDESTAELIKQESRKYAKRQLTWFRADKEIIWLDASLPLEQLRAEASKIITSAGIQ